MRSRVSVVPGLVVEAVRADVLEQRRPLFVLGLRHGGDRIQWLVLDLDGVPRVLRAVSIVGDDDRDQVSDETDPVGCEGEEDGTQIPGDRPRKLQRAERALQLGGGDHGHHTGHRAGVRRVERDDPRMGHRAPDERRLEGSRPGDVVDVATAPAEDAIVLDTGDALADEARGAGHTRLARIERSPRRTWSTNSSGCSYAAK